MSSYLIVNAIDTLQSIEHLAFELHDAFDLASAADRRLWPHITGGRGRRFQVQSGLQVLAVFRQGCVIIYDPLAACRFETLW